MPTGVYQRARPSVRTEFSCRECGVSCVRMVCQGRTREFCSVSCAAYARQRPRHRLPGTPTEIEDLLWRLYWREAKSTPQIAAMFDTNHSVIKGWMRRLDIPRRKKGQRLRVTCKVEGCEKQVYRITHNKNGSQYGQRCRAHWTEWRRAWTRHYKSSRYERLTEEERWLRIAKETLIMVRKMSRAPSL